MLNYQRMQISGWITVIRQPEHSWTEAIWDVRSHFIQITWEYIDIYIYINMGYPTITTDHYRNICNLIYHSHKYIIIYPDQFDHSPPPTIHPSIVEHIRRHYQIRLREPCGSVAKVELLHLPQDSWAPIAMLVPSVGSCQWQLLPIICYSSLLKMTHGWIYPLYKNGDFSIVMWQFTRGYRLDLQHPSQKLPVHVAWHPTFCRSKTVKPGRARQNLW